MPEDDVPVELTTQDPVGPWAMARLADGWCAALDRSTLRCTIYARRPAVCRDYAVGEEDCVAQRAAFWAP